MSLFCLHHREEKTLSSVALTVYSTSILLSLTELEFHFARQFSRFAKLLLLLMLYRKYLIQIKVRLSLHLKLKHSSCAPLQHCLPVLATAAISSNAAT